MVLLDIGQTADPGAHGNAYTIAILISHLHAGVIEGLHAGGYSILDEQIELARFLGRHVGLDIEIADRSAEACTERTDVHMLDRADTTLAREGRLPTAVYRIAQ